MKWKEIEKRYGDYMNSKEDEQSDIGLNNFHRTKVWERIRNGITPVRSLKPFWWAVASVVGTIVVLSAFHSIKMTQKNREIVSLEAELIALKDSENNLNKHVRQLQNNLKLAQNQPIISKTIITRTKDRNVNSDTSIINKKRQTTSDSVGTIPVTVADTFKTEYSVAVSGETNLTDSLMLKEYDESNIALVNDIVQNASKKGVIHYKIDYGSISSSDKLSQKSQNNISQRSRNNISQRSWKLTVTYK